MQIERLNSLAILSIISIAISTGSANANTSLEPAEGGTLAKSEENQITPQDLQSIAKSRSAQGNVFTIPGGKGTLTSNAWRSTFSTSSGNTLQWDYVVSAVYTGNAAVERIRTAWYGSSSLRNGASINLGIDLSGASGGLGANWQHTQTPTKYWENKAGATSADYKSNLLVTPAIDYRSNTISIVNTATVVLKGDPKVYSITSGV